MWGVTRHSHRRVRGYDRSFAVGVAKVSLHGPAEHTTLEIEGELDFTNAADLLALVGDLPHTVVAVDVSALDFADSAGVAALTQLADRAGARLGELPVPINGVRPSLQRVFEMVARGRIPV